MRVIVLKSAANVQGLSTVPRSTSVQVQIAAAWLCLFTGRPKPGHLFPASRAVSVRGQRFAQTSYALFLDRTGREGPAFPYRPAEAGERSALMRSWCARFAAAMAAMAFMIGGAGLADA